MVVLAIIFLICCVAVTAITLDKQRNGYLSRRKKKRYTALIIGLAIASMFCFLAAYINADHKHLYGMIFSFLG